MGQVGGDLESNMSVRTLDSLTVSIDTTAVLYVSLGLLAVMLVCVAISCIPCCASRHEACRSSDDGHERVESCHAGNRA